MFSDNDEFRPEISGVYLTAKDGKLEAVSTDKFIIYRYYKQIPDEIVFHILISGRCASMLDGLLGAGESVVSISTDGCSSFFNTAKASYLTGGLKGLSRIMEGSSIVSMMHFLSVLEGEIVGCPFGIPNRF